MAKVAKVAKIAKDAKVVKEGIRNNWGSLTRRPHGEGSRGLGEWGRRFVATS